MRYEKKKGKNRKVTPVMRLRQMSAVICSRLCQGSVETNRFQGRVLNRMNPMVGNRITVQCNRNEAHMVVADGARLYQVVHVVLVNAFKYTRK
eukprot:scaffold288859_cov22-Tisochrysis_lutea.AAC.1